MKNNHYRNSGMRLLPPRRRSLLPVVILTVLAVSISGGGAASVSGTANSAPALTAGSTQVSITPVNRFGINSTVVSATFTDSDEPGVDSFGCSFRIRQPDNTTELILLNNVTNGLGGLIITDNGGGFYTAEYAYDPANIQPLGAYDLYFQVSDGTDLAIDGYANNLDELEINEVVTNNAPNAAPGAARVSQSPVNRIGTGSTLITATFTDADNPAIGSFAVTIKIRRPDNSTELTLVNNLSHGMGGLTIVDNAGSYAARFSYNPDDAQTLGLYDLYFQVSDGTDSASDGYANNLDELEIISAVGNSVPALAKGITSSSPPSVDRQGTGAALLSATFTDADQPGIGAFHVSFAVRHPYNAGQTVIANALAHGSGGMTITDNGGGSYTARISWDPPSNAVLGFYDLTCTVSDGVDAAIDGYIDNADELQITSAGENAPPVVISGAATASPSAVERVGANPTTVSATFTDADIPGPAAFAVTFKLRDPNNNDEIVLASNVGNGVGGVTITDGGAGSYTASISWDPGNANTLGTYDLYFHVTDGADTSYDSFQNNLDELEVHDAIANSPPTITAGATTAIPNSITRLGSEYTMIQASFADLDMPGQSAFTVTIKVRDASSAEYTIVNAAGHNQQGLRIQKSTAGVYTASVLWNPPTGQVTGFYDLHFSVTDNNAATATDGYANNGDELQVTATAILGDGNLLRRTNDAANCGGPNSACHNLAGHQSQDCLVCHAPHHTSNIYLIRDTIQTPNSGPKPVVFKTLGIGDPYNDPDPTPGDPNSGVMADDSDGTNTGVCEVCHTATSHHRNDGNAPIPAHNNSKNCAGCHPHADGFAAGESNGGVNCSCHQDIFVTMDSTSALSRHILAHTDATYTTGASGMYSIKNCLTCHVDHDIFRPDLNSGFGQRAKNLRVDYGTDPVQGSSTVLANSDYSTAGQGGLCLSCHSGATCSGCHSAHITRPAGTQTAQADVPTTWEHTFITKSEYDAATSAHNYDVPSTFTADASTFNANCVKCHNDDLAKSYQSSTDKFSLHGSTFRKILDPTGLVSPTNPLEEDFCFKCHSSAKNQNAGSNQDYYGAKTMSARSLRIDTDINQVSKHPVSFFTGIHAMAETLSTMIRHVECSDCHDPHAATNTNPLVGVTGIDTLGAIVRPADNLYEVCFKCHSDRPGTKTYVARRNPSMNTRLEFGSSALSFHPVADSGRNRDVPSLIGGWTESSIMTCGDCHGSATAGSAQGPHGSQYSPILKLRQVFGDSTQQSTTVFALCYSCHSQSSILGDNSFGEHDKHVRGEDASCTICHDSHGVVSVAEGSGSHLINFDTDVVTPASNGWLRFIDDGNNRGTCWLTCHGVEHDGWNY